MLVIFEGVRVVFGFVSAGIERYVGSAVMAMFGASRRWERKYVTFQTGTELVDGRNVHWSSSTYLICTKALQLALT